ncbi:Mini-ribonuclease 3 [Desulforamulus aquiferis]|uniref:Mini-ribonuclease 3 n=1 Tax=Desulforamulus aquiferis TaxID=1397668 RepID=A0AAW7ZI82_9FIRM|nr:ribonuclease III domain-containing protein [Desulforamulus aquiferis]MDO7788947.1 ribonuclease III domain-containing protein [Desulforamulus aquiferis]
MLDNFIINQKDIEPKEVPALVLAYVGDAVYELVVREMLVGRGMTKVQQLHREAVKYVRASAQAGALFALEDILSEEEMAVVRRGRNAKSGIPPKGSNVVEYRHATALESLVGYLYLQGRSQRAREIIAKAMDTLDMN